MKKLVKSLFIGGAALFLGNSAVAQTRSKAPVRKTPITTVKKQIADLKKYVGNYADRLIDERPATTYDAGKDFLAYPVTVNYTVDSLNYGNNYNAYFQEAIVVVFNRDEINNTPNGQQEFNRRLAPDLVHESLHFIQQQKLRHLCSQKEAQNLVFSQAYEIAVCKETAAHVADKLALKMNAANRFNLRDFIAVINNEAHRYLGQGVPEEYKTQFFNEAKDLFNPNAKAENTDDFLKVKAAILSIYVNVDGQMKPVNLLPLLLKENLDLLAMPATAQKEYLAEREVIDRNAQNNRQNFAAISEEQKMQLIKTRFKSNFRAENKSVRSQPLSLDVSAYFPRLSAEEYASIEALGRQPDTAAHQEALNNILQQPNSPQPTQHLSSELYAKR